MIFSTQELQSAMTVLTKYYDKVILVDFDCDSYKIIKMNDREYNFYKKYNLTFNEWMMNFQNSPFSMNLNYNFDYDILRKLDAPLTLNYKKVIDGKMTDVTMEIIPRLVNTIDSSISQAYILVKDFTSIKKCKEHKEDCETCSEQCC